VIASSLISAISLSIEPTIQPVAAAPVTISKTPSRPPFYSKDGRFSINFPTPPTISNDQDQSNEANYSFRVDDGKSFYIVNYFDNSELSKFSGQEARKLLIEAVNIFIRGAEAQLLNTKSIQLGTSPGQEFNFTLLGTQGQGRVYIVGKRVYLVIGASNSPPQNLAFLNSFRLR
jgi:hypothetical protein